MFNWLFGKKESKPTHEAPKARKSLFSTHEFDTLDPDRAKFAINDKLDDMTRKQPALYGEFAMDDSSNGVANFKTYANGINTVSDAVIGWYATQGFIGAQLCGILAQNWLVNKACAMPADDAIRKGYNIVTVDGDELDPDAVKIIKAYDKAYRLNWHMREFIRKGRIFGVRVAMFKVQSTDPQYYEKPFNIDGVTPGSYKGIVQVDPYWTAPMLDGASASQPDTLHFYEPTWWIINGKKIHRSHLIIFRHAEPVDVLKPQYIYGGVPLTQQIMERVYAAERTSNEAPQLAMSKRTTVWLTDMEAVMQDTNAAIGRLSQWAQFRDNYGIKMGDKEGDEFQQFDTSLADFDALIMTQYQLVAAIAGVPATKLLGTSPKGFNATGEYEEASYHELLESIQTNDLTPLAERHHQLVIKSFVIPKMHIDLDVDTTLNWLPLDTPTAEELAATNLSKAQTGQVLIQSGAISSEDERQRVATDKQGGYNEIGIMQNDDPEAEEEAEESFLGVQDGDFADPEDGEPALGEKFSVAQDDAKWEEKKHPRAKNGQFGSGGGGAAKKSEGGASSEKGSQKESQKQRPKEEILSDIESLMKTAKSRIDKSHENKGEGVSVSGSEIEHLTSKEKEELHSLKEEMKPYEKNEQSEASERIKARIEARKQAKAGFEKVKELPNGGWIDQHGFEHQAGLSGHEQGIEDNFYREILKDTPKLVADYKATFGNTIDPDSVKKLDPSFAKDSSLAAAVHEPSSYLSKVIWNNALAEKKAAGDKSPVLFTAGGSGSGKSEAMHMAKDILGTGDDPLTFDSVLGNFDKSVKKIDEALKGQDGPVDIVYTNASLDLAVFLNLKRGRTVRLDTQLDAHIAASNNIRKLAEHYKGNDRVKITVVNNNSGEPPFLTEGTMKQVPKYNDKAEMKQRAISFAEKVVAEGRIPDGEKKLKMLMS